MSTLTLDGLQALLGALGVDESIPFFPDAHVLVEPLDIYHCYLAATLIQLVNCEPDQAYQAIQCPTELSNGDFTIVLPRLRLKDVKPAELAADLVKRFPRSPLFSLPFADGSMLRVFVSTKTLPRVLLPYIRDRDAAFGLDKAGTSTESDYPPKKVVIEFSSPNIGPPFTPSHLRSTLVGAALAAAHAAHGWAVVRLNYLGDWGKHVGLLAAGWARNGDEEALRADALRCLRDVHAGAEKLFRAEMAEIKRAREEGRDDDVKRLEAEGVYAERDAFFSRLEQGDEEAMALCAKFRDASVAQYNDLYKQLGIVFDEFDGESLVPATTVADVEEKLRAAGVYEEAPEGGWRINFDAAEVAGNGKKLGAVVARFRTGTTSYLLRDIAAAIDRDKRHKPDRMLYVAAADQKEHFQQVFRALEIVGLGELRSRLEHIDVGKVQNLESGETDGLLLEDVIGRARTAAETAIEAMPDEFIDFNLDDDNTIPRLIVSTLFVQDLAVRRASGVHFDAAAIMSPEYDNGLTLQRWHARVSRIVSQAATGSKSAEMTDYTSLEDEDAADMLRMLAQFPGLVKNAFANLELSSVVAYLFNVVEQLSVIMDEPDSIKEGITAAQVVLYESVRQTLDSGTRLIGVVPSCA